MGCCAHYHVCARELPGLFRGSPTGRSWRELKTQLFCSLLVPAKKGSGAALNTSAMGLARYMEVAITSPLMESSMTLMGIVTTWLLR